MARSRTQSEISGEIGQLAGLSRTDLALQWKAIYGSPPPKGVKRGLLERACAHKLQTEATSGLKPAVHKALPAIAVGTPVERPSSNQALKPGARLIREWNGKVHQVDVTDGSFIWNGQNYRSLSAIARAITGTGWSGPRFFGL